MNREELAKEMRLAAISDYKIVTLDELTVIRRELLQLYFDAGRWKGGDRDWAARQAFETYNQRERKLVK